MATETDAGRPAPEANAPATDEAGVAPTPASPGLPGLTVVDRRLADIVDAARIGAWTWNMQTGELWLNPRWAEMLGYSLAELEPTSIDTCSQLRHPEDQAAAMVKVQRHLSGLETYFEAEVRMRHKAGHWVWILDRARLVSRSADGQPLIMVGAHQDISARKAAETELARVNERLQLCMDVAGIGTWEKDLDSGDVRLDPRGRDIYGFDAAEEPVSNDEAVDRVHPDDRPMIAANGRLALETGAVVQSRYRVLAPAGLERHVQEYAVASTGPTGRPILLGVSRDVTDEVRRTNELDAKRIEAEAAVVAKSQFLATMSHEIRTPMNGVIGMLEVLRRAELQPAQQEHAEIALQSAVHLMRILDEILEMSRLEAGQMRLAPQDVDVRAMVLEVVDLFGRSLVGRDVELSAEVSDDLPEWVFADEGRLRQILTNFVGNALKFTKAGQIVVEAGYRSEPGHLVLAVRDTGIGLAPEDRERLFQRFVQADASTTRRYGGTGLGLAICREYAELMGGTIGVESEPGVGSRFWLDVPAAPGERQGADESADDEVAARVLKILVAEDNETNQRVIAALLSSFGHSFTIVPDGAQAVAAAASDHFDAILMDIQMPVMDGPTATGRIRELGGWARMVPVIALTANAMLDQRAEYLAAGMTDYVSKPIEVAALYAALARVP